MKPAPFEYHAPDAVPDALSLLREFEDEDCKLLAGGQSLVPLMNLRLARPGHLVDLNRIADLRGVRRSDGGWVLGAMTRHADIEDSADLRDGLELLPFVASHIGYRQIRTRGTVGGACCHADPVAEWPAIMRLLDATFEVRGVQGERSIAAADFFYTVFTPALEPTELLTHIHIPALPPRSGWGFTELARKVGDYAVVSAAAVVTLDGDGTLSAGRLAYSGVASVPLRASATEDALAGLAPGDHSGLQQAVEAGIETLDPPDDIHGSPHFRRQVARTLGRRALQDAIARATGGDS